MSPVSLLRDFTPAFGASMVMFCPAGTIVTFAPGTRVTAPFSPLRLVTPAPGSSLTLDNVGVFSSPFEN